MDDPVVLLLKVDLIFVLLWVLIIFMAIGLVILLVMQQADSQTYELLQDVVRAQAGGE